MRVYYHIYSISKRECRFNFSYVRGGMEDVVGNARVDFSTSARRAVFDPKSENILSDEEKRGIVSFVLKHI